MLANPAKSLAVLEIMYMCLSLGFMGRYRLSPRGPAEIDQLREDVYAAIASMRPRADAELSPTWRGVAAAYRPSRGHVPIWVFGAFGIASIGGLFIWFSLSLNRSSDALYERMLQAPPTSMPALTRPDPVRPLTVAPAAQSGALEQLRAFLKPEIDAKKVVVLGTENAPIIRLQQGGLFASGSATLDTGADPLLERIGGALKAEPGIIEVLGYTDNQPIRTARFPSNFQLSAARAQVAAAILERKIGGAKRVTSQGRGDADPIASNATPEGRNENRRIEIVLNRQG